MVYQLVQKTVSTMAELSDNSMAPAMQHERVCQLVYLMVGEMNEN